MQANERFRLYAADALLDTHDHLAFLRECAHGNVVEIGVWSGISTCALLSGVELRGGHVWSIDINASFRYAWHGHPQWTFLHGDSKNLSWPVPEKLDVLFVDGDHSYEGCVADLRIWGPRADLILVHDADTPAFPGVRRAIDEFVRETGRPCELRTGSNGLEVIR